MAGCRLSARWRLAVPLLIFGASALAADPPADAELFQFPADRNVAVNLQLWPLGLKSGRDAPVFHNFMAQLRFSGEPEVLTCALRLYDPEGQLNPGETQDLAIRCLQPFRVKAKQPDFQVFAAGRPIGKGQLRSAALAQVMGEPGAATSAASAPP